MNEKVKQALENLKIIRFYVGACSEEVCEYFKQVEKTLNDFDRYHESQQDLIKGKDEYITKLCCDRAELKEEIKRLDSQYKNIHNTKVKVPLCDILNGLSRAERERVIEDIYYSQAERQDFYDNKISKLETELKELQEFAKIISDNTTTYKSHKMIMLNNNMLCGVSFEQLDLVKKVVEKYGKN